MMAMLQSFSQRVSSVEIDGKQKKDWHFYPGRTSFVTVKLDSAVPAGAQLFVIYVDNIPVRKIYPIGPVAGTSLNYRFDFSTQAQLMEWKSFFHANDGANQLDGKIITVGLETGILLNSAVKVDVQLVKTNATGWAWGIGLILLAAFVYALFWTEIFREPTTIPGTPKTKFSLSRVQFGVWNILILFSAAFIYLYTGRLLAIPPQLLGLIGISGGQFILGWALARTPSGETLAKESSGNVVEDIGEGVHRFQNLLWSIALWIYFIQALLVTVDYPAIDANLLILTGFTVGLYAFGKAKETNTEARKLAKRKIDDSNQNI
ncbi:hypothetical protein BUE76_07830 [Cnuella takakiae]|nr:hypothetical protein BUE76_07830 [Cnuella takakiae]